MNFQCQNCYNNLSKSENNHSPEGHLRCANCNTVTPIVNGIIYFTETDLSFGEDHLELANRIQDKRDEYIKFMDRKVSKQLVDPYSAFQPFNESSRSFYPFIASLKSRVLKPNDVILDTWCRTGWSALFLAAMFPEQMIISIWEGNKDVLGYQGFDYWFAQEKCPENLQVLFCDINRPLPIKSDSVKLVHGLDTLHRYHQPTLISELLRITHPEGVIVFPHIHLTNSEPEPFFERGEKQLHGAAYDHYFKELLKNRNRQVFINSEPRMFGLERAEVISNDPETKDYNAIIALIPDKWNDFELTPYRLEDQEVEEQSIIPNPYLDIDLNCGSVNLDNAYLNGVVGEMLERHPIYHQKIQHAHRFSLTQQQCKILYMASHGYSNKKILEKLTITTKQFIAEVSELSKLEIVHVLPLSTQALALQAFHSAQQLQSEEIQTLHHLRTICNKSYHNSVLINSADASEISLEDTDYLVGQIKQRFIHSEQHSTNRILISSTPHFESILIFWAAVEIGWEVGLINTELPNATKQKLVDDLNPAFIFVDHHRYTELVESLDRDLIVLDPLGLEELDQQTFSTWLEQGESIPIEHEPIVSHDQTAAILYTSGTTGIPKGIELSQGALYRSGQILSKIYNWTSNDRLLMTTELDSMSGLRNICIATQFTGTTIVVADFDGPSQILAIVEAIKSHRITLLTATPALISQLLSLGSKICEDIRSLRQVICTGGKLTSNLVEDFKSVFGLQVYNYYGLTETTGLCIAEFPNKTKSNSIGVSIDSIAQIVDENDQVLAAGEVGRLRIFNDRLMTGYLDPTQTSNLQVMNDWLYTGDMASLDADGYYQLMGREREIIKDLKGNIAYLSEVEGCLSSHARVKDVIVCPISHLELEQLAAFVILHSPTDDHESLVAELKNYVSQKIGKWKAPLFVEFLDQFPYDNRGQVNKSDLVDKISIH